MFWWYIVLYCVSYVNNCLFSFLNVNVGIANSVCVAFLFLNLEPGILKSNLGVR